MLTISFYPNYLKDSCEYMMYEIKIEQARWYRYTTPSSLTIKHFVIRYAKNEKAVLSIH